ncbi:hypothetical protein F7725_009478 [Dissostichus mawsoni]|uniref:Uncharacterized protein n=1 Tax=Dissostichus mawsoni TaxID=36200 RepID=A0A7J5XL32_DISMA|nr:hypothetical protein F7725_009478 [Dissostichus mawsoni]
MILRTVIIIRTSLLMATISSFNGNGLKSKIRRERALILCEARNTLGWGCVDEVKKEWMGEVFANNGSVHARGVAILINSGVVKNARMVEDDGEGRMIGVQYEYMGEMFKLIKCMHLMGKRRERFF